MPNSFGFRTPNSFGLHLERTRSMAEEGESKMPVPPVALDSKHNSDLIHRLNAFIPQLKAANQDLATAESVPRVDVDLQSEKDDEDDNSSNGVDDGDEPQIESTEKDSDSQPQEGDAQPTIQIQFALGDMKENPLMELLAEGSNASQGGDDESESDDCEEEKSKKRMVSGLLSDIKQPSTAEQQGSKKKNPLITEL